MSEIAATPTTFPPIDRGHKQAESEQPKKRRSKNKKLPKIEHYKTFKPPERDYRDTELEKFSTFISSYTVGHAMTVSGNEMTVEGNDMTVVENDMTVVENDMTVDGNNMTVVENDMTVVENDMIVDGYDMTFILLQWRYKLINV